MCGRHLADTRCGLMILLLLSYVTEQLTARTGTRNRYHHCLSNLRKLDSFFPVGVSFLFHHFQILSKSLSFTSPFMAGTLALLSPQITNNGKNLWQRSLLLSAASLLLILKFRRNRGHTWYHHRCSLHHQWLRHVL